MKEGNIEGKKERVHLGKNCIRIVILSYTQGDFEWESRLK